MGNVLYFRKKSAGRRYQRRSRPRKYRTPVWTPIAALVVGAGFVYLASEASFSRLRTSTAPAPSRAADAIQGRATVIDGDTIEPSGYRVRFNGVDAPETFQLCQDAKRRTYRCGSKSAEALSDFLAKSRPVRCTFVEWDQHGRYVGNCVRADGENIASWLVENGHALDWPRYSRGAYSVQQETARDLKRGLWAGTFEEPWEWRAAQLSQEQSTIVPLISTGSRACNIKGNINDEGERIYHLPSQTYYDQTGISKGRGERWFCTEQEARDAGWRRARR